MEDSKNIKNNKKAAMKEDVEDIKEETKDTCEQPNPYKSIDLKFVGKYKKYISDHIETFASQYLKLIRPTNDKTVSIDAQAKDQIMYIFYKLLGIMSKMGDDVPEEVSEIPTWVENSLGTKTSDYKIYKFLTGSTQGLKYSFMGETIEEDTLLIISEFVEDEDLMQNTVELFLLFIKRFADTLANLNWESTKRTNNKLVNGLLRNMNYNNTNPDIFGEIYEFSNYCKLQNLKKKCV